MSLDSDGPCSKGHKWFRSFEIWSLTFAMLSLLVSLAALFVAIEQLKRM